MWYVYDEIGDIYARLDDLYEAATLAEAIGGRIELRLDQ